MAVPLPPAFAAAPAAREVAKANPRLASLQIEIWPEFDRPAVLVLLKGEIASDVPLPAAVHLRIPASSGGPAAAAYSAGSSSNLLNLNYDRKDAGAFIELSFHAPERIFHIEFYDPLVTSVPARSYTYVWTGDLAADRLSVILQEPATARDLSVQPPLDATASGPDGLRYRSAELGAFQAGKQLDVKVRYTKTESRTSAEILKLKAPESSSLPIAAGPGKREFAIWFASVVAALVLGAIAAYIWWYRRNRASAPQPGAAESCRKCKAPSAPGDRFCSNCGAPLR